jgi:hypothetical protein
MEQGTGDRFLRGAFDFKPSVLGSQFPPKSRELRDGFRRASSGWHVVAFDLQLWTLRPLVRVQVQANSYRGRCGWVGSGFEQIFDAAHGFGFEQDIVANVADLGGNVAEHHHLTPVFDSIHDGPGLIGSGASRNSAFHGWLLLFRGAKHFGDRGL